MKKLHTLGMGAVVATAAFSLFSMTAVAQQPPATPPAQPGVVAPVKPAAPPVTAKTTPTTTPATTTVKKPVKAASVCKGLDETACKANTECGYVVPTKADAKTGKVDKAYCRKVAGVALKPKPTVSTAPATTTAKPATATTTTPAVVKPTTPGTTTKQ